jgi:hypothetical protein
MTRSPNTLRTNTDNAFSTDSEVPAPLIKIEGQSQDQLAYLGYGPRGDWTTTTTPPTAQYPMGLNSHVPDLRRLQAAGT